MSGPVNSLLTRVAFLAAKKEAKSKETEDFGWKRGTYLIFSAQTKAEIVSFVISAYTTRLIKGFNHHLHSYLVLIIMCIL